MNQESKAFTITKWVLGAAVAYAASFFIMGVIKGIVGLAVAVALAVILPQLWPLIQFMIRNAIINAFKWRASKDPIGSAQVVEMDLAKELEEFREETISIEADTSAFERQVKQVERDYPGDPQTEELKDQLVMLKETVASRRQAEKEFAQNLDNYRAGIERMKVMWSASQTGAKAAKRAKMNDKQYQKLVVQTSFDTVQKSMDEAKARLAAERARREEQRALPSKAMHASIPTGAPRLVPVAKEK